MYPHLGITCITMLKPLIYKALRRFYGVMAMDSFVSPSINPYATRVCGVFHWNHGKYTEMRKISTEVRGLCEDYAAKFSDNVSPIGVHKSTTMSASSVQSKVILANPLYIAIVYITLLYFITCVFYRWHDTITHLIKCHDIYCISIDYNNALLFEPMIVRW